MMNNPLEAIEILRWHLDAGIDETIGDAPVNRLATPVLAPPLTGPIPASPAPAPKPFGVSLASSMEAVEKAKAAASACHTLEALVEAIRAFDAISIKKTAINTVIYDGNPKAPILIIGEAPGAQEDMQGIPFCGPSGQLMDKMLAAIGLDRTRVCITNTVYWRPPGNRTPSAEEISICQPFVQKFIALMQPKLLFLFGGVAATAMLGTESALSRLRLKTHTYTNPQLSAEIPALVTYHPSYLLRTPSQKKLAWQDLQFAQGWLKNNNA